MITNLQDHAVLHIARIVLEADTPLSISTGSPDNVFDTALVRDANDLPAIPGTALAGVLRHLWHDIHGKISADALFGHQTGQQARRSRLTVSWGALLDSTGQPVEGLLIGERQARLNDPLYAAARAQIDEPVFRNRVRLTHKGGAAETGKFDRSVLPAGNRFALELRLWSEDIHDPAWHQLLNLFAHPGLRLGGATRAGLGRMRCQAVAQRSFDLRAPADRDDFVALDRGLIDTRGLQSFQPQINDTGWLTATLRLTANGLWRIGQGSQPLDDATEKPADLLPVVEERVTWVNGRGERTPAMILLPGSSLKGALAHRMIFHARRLTGDWNVSDSDKADALPPAVTALLGEVKDKAREGREAGGQAGALFIDDASLPVADTTVTRLMHNAIDRFTGGVRAHMLFEEESLFGGELAVELALDTQRLEGENAATARRALRAALEDLCQGRLALGSRTTAGNGFFSGRLDGPLADWLERHDTAEEEVA